MRAVDLRFGAGLRRGANGPFTCVVLRRSCSDSCSLSSPSRLGHSALRCLWLAATRTGLLCEPAAHILTFRCLMFALLIRFHTDPSGTFTKYEAKAIGAGSEGAQTALEEQYNKVITSLLLVSCIHYHRTHALNCFQSLKLYQAQKMALTILKQVMEEKLSPTNVEVTSEFPPACLLAIL